MKPIHLQRLSEATGLWSAPPEKDGPAPAASEAARRFSVLVRRYLSGELTGRSILIGGGRGAGKTLMVHDTIRRLMRHTSDREPLLVPLYGPSLLAIHPTEDPNAAPLSEDLLKALVKALHHAVLHRMIRAMADSPPYLARRVQVERAELAEQLRVDMMRAEINLSRLRSWWQHAEGLPKGILFPDAGRLQGYREVSTIWALAQIYMMISGTYQKSHQETAAASLEARMKADASMEGRNLLNPLVGLLSGGVMAAGLFNTSPVLAALASVLTAVGATTALNVTTERILKATDASTLDFKEDLSPRALPRWLPHILQQLRDIGLYPIFVVDELDKLRPEAELEAFTEHIKLLRGMLSESAFFCFVVDRAWYQQVEEQAHSTADPSNCRFTDRLFVSHLPSELRRYVADLAHPDPGAPDPPEIWQRWSWIMVHHARSQPYKLREVLARYTDDEAPLYASQDPRGWPQRGELLLQIAVEHLVEHGALYVHLREHPSRLQLALDVLYLPSSCWETGEEVEASEAWVRAHLHRRNLPPEGDPLLTLLVLELQELCRILVDPARITDTEAEKTLLAGLEPLLEPAGAGKYRWTKAWLVA